MIEHNPEEYKGAAELSILHVHDGTTELSVCPTLLHDSPSPKGEALFLRHNHEPPQRSKVLLGRSFRFIPFRSSGCFPVLEG